MKLGFKIVIKQDDLKIRKFTARTTIKFKDKSKYSRKNKHKKDFYETKNI